MHTPILFHGLWEIKLVALIRCGCCKSVITLFVEKLFLYPMLFAHGLSVNVVWWNRCGGQLHVEQINPICQMIVWKVISNASSIHTQHRYPLSTVVEANFCQSSKPLKSIFCPVGKYFNSSGLVVAFHHSPTFNRCIAHFKIAKVEGYGGYFQPSGQQANLNPSAASY